MIIPADVDVIDLPTSINWFDAQGIFCSVSKKNVSRNLTIVEQSFAEISDRAKHKKICVLKDLSHLSFTSKDVRDYVAEEVPKFIKALAMISNSPMSRMMARLFIILKKEPFPARLFNNETEAKAWLQQHFMKQENGE